MLFRAQSKAVPRSGDRAKFRPARERFVHSAAIADSSPAPAAIRDAHLLPQEADA